MNFKVARRSRNVGTGLLLATTLLAAGCGGGGGSGVGYQDDAEPEALAEILGASTSTSGTVSARSGSELLLTGKDSEGYDDPVMEFEWRQVDDSGIPVTLIERSSNTRALTVPWVSAPTTLSFELTVTDSDGKQSRDRVNLRVEPIDDADLFLRLQVDEPSRYQYALVVATEPGEAGGGEFTLTIDTLARWPDREGTTRQRVLASETLQGHWPATGLGAPAAGNSFFNPLILRDLPSFDADDVNQHYEAEPDRNLRLELDEIDDTELLLRFTLESFDRNARVYARRPDGSMRQLFATANGVVDSGLVPVDSLHANGGLESADSASKYYALIDAPATLRAWLERAGFGATPANQPGVAHANYLNNYDLGFGREMYLRVDSECGDVYSYVNNYPNLENAIQRRNRFATVAMEYSAIDGSCHGDKVVKFLAYAPDESSGEDVLARSMNFDGRGEKFIPGVCVACHRGAINDLASLSLDDIDGLDSDSRFALAHMESTFIPWDMDALLFVDDDPAITANYDRISQAQRDANARETLQPAIRALNEGVLATYRARPARYAAPIKLVHGWYGGYASDGACLPDGSDPMPAVIDALPEHDFDGSFIQCGWRQHPALYREVFASHCRSCHTQTDKLDKNFDTAAELLANPALLPYVFDQGSMPLARLTYDRFWLDFNGGTSAGERMASLLDVHPELRPGRPIARFALSYLDSATAAPREQPSAGDTVRLDASGSYYAERFDWRVDSDCGDSPAIQGRDRASAAFQVARGDCIYRVSLSVGNALGEHSHTEQLAVAAEP